MSASDLQALNALKFFQQNQNNHQSYYQHQSNQHLSNNQSSNSGGQNQRQILGLNQLLQQDCNSNQMKNWQNINISNNTNDSHLDRAARFHRSSAALHDATCTWSGFLQPRMHKVVNYSPKVFLGGIPWDISEQSLIQIFKPFGPIKYAVIFSLCMSYDHFNVHSFRFKYLELNGPAKRIKLHSLRATCISFSNPRNRFENC